MSPILGKVAMAGADNRCGKGVVARVAATEVVITRVAEAVEEATRVAAMEADINRATRGTTSRAPRPTAWDARPHNAMAVDTSRLEAIATARLCNRRTR